VRFRTFGAGCPERIKMSFEKRRLPSILVIYRISASISRSLHSLSSLRLGMPAASFSLCCSALAASGALRSPSSPGAASHETRDRPPGAPMRARGRQTIPIARPRDYWSDVGTREHWRSPISKAVLARQRSRLISAPSQGVAKRVLPIDLDFQGSLLSMAFPGKGSRHASELTGDEAHQR
jgi:hypothetical protein